jgi:FSR family fosmidomycin resistance protein-like MFS transporter
LWYYYPSGRENDENAKGARICPEDPQMANIPTFPRMDVAKVALLSLGHLVVDIYPSFLAALLPLLIDRLGLSMALASFLASILMFSTSLSQPLFGILSDRIGGKTLMFWGPLMAGAGMSFIALLPSYTLLLLFLVISGLGVSCFHPQAAALAGHFSGPRKGVGLSLFMLGGNVGYGLGPAIILSIVLGLGLRRSYVALLPAAIFALLLARYLPGDALPLPAVRAEERAKNAVTLRDLSPFAHLWLIVWLRSTAIISLATFLPTLQTMRGLSLAGGGSSFTVFMICGAMGGFVGGALSDRFGRKRIVVLSLLLIIPMVFCTLRRDGPFSALPCSDFFPSWGKHLVSPWPRKRFREGEEPCQDSSWGLHGEWQDWAYLEQGFSLICSALSKRLGISCTSLPQPSFSPFSSREKNFFPESNKNP